MAEHPDPASLRLPAPVTYVKLLSDFMSRASWFLEHNWNPSTRAAATLIRSNLSSISFALPCILLPDGVISNHLLSVPCKGLQPLYIEGRPEASLPSYRLQSFRI